MKRYRNMASFKSKDEKSLDELKTKLLFEYKSKKKLFKYRRLVKRNANLVKSMDNFSKIEKTKY